MQEEHTPGPWLVTMWRDEYGTTSYKVLGHCETAISVEPAGYYEDGYEPPTDQYGYYQPDENMDCMAFRVANARLIAAAPDLLDALQDALCALECCGKDYPAMSKARAAIAKATGHDG